MRHGKYLFPAHPCRTVLNGVEGGAGYASCIGKFLLQNSELAAALRKLRAQGDKRRVISGRLALLMTGPVYLGHLSSAPRRSAGPRQPC